MRRAVLLCVTALAALGLVPSVAYAGSRDVSPAPVRDVRITTVTSTAATLAWSVPRAGRTGELAAFTSSDPLGRWSAASLPPGSYVVCFSADGLTSQCWKRVPWTEELPFRRATRVSTTTGSVTRSVDGDLSRAAVATPGR